MNLIIFQILCLILFIFILVLIILFFIYRKKNNSSQDKIQTLIEDLLSSLIKKLNSADPKSNYSLMENISPGYDKRIKIEEDINYLDKLLNLFIYRSDRVIYLFDYVVENIPFGILLIDCEKRIVKINSSLINCLSAVCPE